MDRITPWLRQLPDHHDRRAAGRVWAIAADVERYPDWAKDVKDVVVRAATSSRPIEVEFRASALGRSTHYTLGYDYSEAPEVLAWKMVRGDIMRSIDGAYHFAATADGGTEVRYDLAIELVVPLPGFVKRRAEVRILNTVRELKTAPSLTRSLTPRRAVGIDVGGTKCLGVVVDDGRRRVIVAENRRPTPHDADAADRRRWPRSPASSRRGDVDGRRRRARPRHRRRRAAVARRT